MVKAINTWAVSLMRYSAGIVEWTLSTGGRGLLSVSDSVNIERRSLQCHVSSTQEKLLKVAQKYIKADELGPKEYKNQRREERTRDGRKNHLLSRFLRCTDEVASSKTWEWLRRGELKKETEGLITAAQDQSLRTNVMKARIEKFVSPMCRMCNAAE